MKYNSAMKYENFEVEFTGDRWKYWERNFSFLFNDKKSYLEFRHEWKKAYLNLSNSIRELKSKRKEYNWNYTNFREEKNKYKIGKNPNYDPNACWQAAQLRHTAYFMMMCLEQAKQEAARQVREKKQVAA